VLTPKPHIDIALAEPVTYVGADADAFARDLPERLVSADEQQLRESVERARKRRSDRPANDFFG
jgi:hypothetical protein